MSSSVRQPRGATAAEPSPEPTRVWAVAEHSSLVVALTMMVPEWDVTPVTDVSVRGEAGQPDAVIVEAATTGEAFAILGALREVGVTAPAVLIGDAVPEGQATSDDPIEDPPPGAADHALLTRPFAIADVRDRIAAFIGTPAHETVPPPPARRGLLARAVEWRGSSAAEPPEAVAGPAPEAALIGLPHGKDGESDAAGSEPVVEEAADTDPARLVPVGSDPVVEHAPPEPPRSDPDPEADPAVDDPAATERVAEDALSPALERPPVNDESVGVEVESGRDDQASVGGGLDGIEPSGDHDGDEPVRPFDARSLLAELINAFDPDNAAIWVPAESGGWVAEASHGLHKAEGRAKVRADQPLFAAVSANLDGALLAPADLARGRLAGVPGSWAEDLMAAGMGFAEECIAVVVVGRSGLMPADLVRLLGLVNGAAPHRPGLGSKLRELLRR